MTASGPKERAVDLGPGRSPARGEESEDDPGVWVVVARFAVEGRVGERTEAVAAYSDVRWAMAHVRSAGTSHYLVRVPLDPPLERPDATEAAP